MAGKDFAKLINHNNFQRASWKSITPTFSSHANITASISKFFLNFKVKGNGHITVESTPWGPHDEKVCFAFMSESEFVWFDEEPSAMAEDDPMLTLGRKNIRRKYYSLPEDFKVCFDILYCFLDLFLTTHSEVRREPLGVIVGR
jgi:hypothetical protein